jgi:large subunit ribosomal protein L23
VKEPISILNQALLTEKATMLSANLNKYSFTVAPNATRTNVKHAIEKTFGVKVLSGNTMNVKPKAKRDRARKNKQGFTSGSKKAIITLQAGDSIDLA